MNQKIKISIDFICALCYTFIRGSVCQGQATADQKRLYETMQAEMELLEGRGIMTENELLLAISDMMDHKLKAELQPIKNDLQTVKNEVQLVKNEVQLVKEDLQVVKDEVQLVKKDLQAVKDEVQLVKKDLQEVKDEVQLVKEDLRAVKEDLQTVKDRVQTVENDLQAVKNEVQAVKNEVQTVKNDLQTVKNEVQTVKNDVHHMKLYQENIIMPRLNTIESCYTDTYSRYRNYSDKMEVAFEDMELLKRVVSEHSMKLQALG